MRKSKILFIVPTVCLNYSETPDFKSLLEEIQPNLMLLSAHL